QDGAPRRQLALAVQLASRPPVTHTRPLLLICAVVLAACGEGDVSTTESPYVARVGDAVFTEADLAEALSGLSPGVDSIRAREQVVNQWVRTELLVQEARSLNLDEEPRVQRLLLENERATLEAATLDRLFETNPAEPTGDELAAYYDANQANLALREPYVRLRHVRTGVRSRAEEARTALDRSASSPVSDSLFTIIAREFGEAPEGAIALAAEYTPESRLLALDEALGLRVIALRLGGTAVVESGDVYHVVQVVDRVGTGEIPTLEMVAPELRERLAIQRRRDQEAQFIQSLRSQAQARNRLDIR
ncbi:MAG: peptidylprolyl isomerase, partial [Bacteroidota bacterium]